jgi:uncharacterized membrane protein
MPTDLIKTLTYLSIHLTIGFSVAYWFTGSISMAGGIAIIEPCINAVAFFFHEKAWKKGRNGRIGRLVSRFRTTGETPFHPNVPVSQSPVPSA